MVTRNPLLQAISAWFRRNFSDPAAISLFFTVLAFFIIIEFFGHILAPILTAIVIAYLLEGIVKHLEKVMPHIAAVIITFIIFLGILALIIFGLLPLMWRQLTSLVNEMPHAMDLAQRWLDSMVAKYPDFFQSLQINQVTETFRAQLVSYGQKMLTLSLSIIPNIIEVVIYLVLVPLLVFFFLKDRDELITWGLQYLPSNRNLMENVWKETNFQIGNYIRGRVIEVIIVTIVSGIPFALLGLNYALLLAVVVGLGTIIPYIGPTVVTLPVVAVALFQWGWSAHFFYLVIVYTIIIIFDGNILVPILFSETMDMSAVAIIVAMVIFGAIWGFWGIFFSIPLATLVKAVFNAWPRSKNVIDMHHQSEE